MEREIRDDIQKEMDEQIVMQIELAGELSIKSESLKALK